MPHSRPNAWSIDLVNLKRILCTVNSSLRCLIFDFHKTFSTFKHKQNNQKFQNVRTDVGEQTKFDTSPWLAVGVAADSHLDCTRTNIPFLSCYFSVKIHFLFSRSRFFFSRSMYGAVSPVTDVYVMRTLNTILLLLPLHRLFIPSSCFPPLIFPSFSHFSVVFSIFLWCETEVSLSFSLSCFGLFLKLLKRKKIH